MTTPRDTAPSELDAGTETIERFRALQKAHGLPDYFGPCLARDAWIQARAAKLNAATPEERSVLEVRDIYDFRQETGQEPPDDLDERVEREREKLKPE